MNNGKSLHVGHGGDMGDVDGRGLADRIKAVTGFNLFEITEEIRERSITMGRLKAKIDFAENHRTVARAMAAERHRARLTDAGEKYTESRLTDLSNSDESYIAHLHELQTLREELVTAEADYYALRNRREDAIEMLRFARSEMMMG